MYLLIGRYVKQIHQPPPPLQSIIPPELYSLGKTLRDRMVVLFLLLPFYFYSFQSQLQIKKKPEANSSARKLIINHKQNYSLYPNLTCELKKWPLVFYLFDFEMIRNIKAFIINLFTFINGLLNEFFNVKYWQIDKHIDRSYRMQITAQRYREQPCVGQVKPVLTHK